MKKLAQHLKGITDTLGDLVVQAGGLPPMRSLYLGSSRRLTSEEREDVVSMLKQTHIYSVQDIATKHAISRAAVYAIRDVEGLNEHKRGNITVPVHA